MDTIGWLELCVNTESKSVGGQDGRDVSVCLAMVCFQLTSHDFQAFQIGLDIYLPVIFSYQHTFPQKKGILERSHCDTLIVNDVGIQTCTGKCHGL